jgi:predicted PurR-regulated permease PerM
MSLPPPTEKQARIIWVALTGLAIGLIIALAAAFVWGLGRVLNILSPVLWPLAVAGVIACLLDPVVGFFQRKGLSRTKSIACVFGIAVLIVAAVFGSIGPQLVNQTRQLASQIPGYVEDLEKRVEHWANNTPRWVTNPPPLLRKFFRSDSSAGENRNPAPSTNAVPTPSAIGGTNAISITTNAPTFLADTLDDKTVQSVKSWLANAAAKIGAWLFGRVTAWFGMAIGLVLIPVYTFYLLLEQRKIETNWMDYLPLRDSTFKNELVFVLRSLENYLVVFFRGQVLVAICEGILYTIGFLMIGLPYALLFGAAATILTIIPFLGAVVLCFSALIIAVVHFGDWSHPLLVLAVVAVVQTLESVVISPKIMRGRVGLHPLTIIVAVMAGTTLLGGLLGGILAIPLTAAMKVILTRYVWKKRDG